MALAQVAARRRSRRLRRSGAGEAGEASEQVRRQRQGGTVGRGVPEAQRPEPENPRGARSLPRPLALHSLAQNSVRLGPNPGTARLRGLLFVCGSLKSLRIMAR